MKDKKIFYRSGYKYQLVKDYTTETKIRPGATIDTDYIRLGMDGALTIKKSYAWDGPSGPTLDTKDSMRGSLEHDAKYQLMREEYISREWRETADEELKETCIKDGMWSGRANLWYIAVEVFAADAASPGHNEEVLEAP